MAEEPPDPYIGRTIAEKYRVDARVGVGNVGTVYRATHIGLARTVALKILRASLAADATAAARFTREARLASQVDHPNVVRVLDAGTDADGLTYLAMELLEGPELADVLAREPAMASERIVELLAQVLAALSAAHRMGIVHRDLKPENILVTHATGDDGRDVERVKVADFGIARVYGEAASPSEAITRFGAVSGTPEYMSPEQAMADELDGRSDLYACGVILYEMLAGRPPFIGDRALEVLEQHVREVPLPPSHWRDGVDARLEAVAMRALEKRREDRYADAVEMRSALVSALDLPRVVRERPPASVLIEQGPSVLIEGSPPSVLIEQGPSVLIEGSAPSVLIEQGASVLIDTSAPSVLIEQSPSILVTPPSAKTSATPASREPGSGRVVAWIALATILTTAAIGGWWLHASRASTVGGSVTSPDIARPDAGPTTIASDDVPTHAPTRSGRRVAPRASTRIPPAVRTNAH